MCMNKGNADEVHRYFNVAASLGSRIYDLPRQATKIDPSHLFSRHASVQGAPMAQINLGVCADDLHAHLETTDEGRLQRTHGWSRLWAGRMHDSLGKEGRVDGRVDEPVNHAI